MLTSAEFERRYAAMPELKKAELIDGIVYMESPLRAEFHGFPHSRLQALVQVYAARNPSFMVGTTPPSGSTTGISRSLMCF